MIGIGIGVGVPDSYSSQPASQGNASKQIHDFMMIREIVAKETIDVIMLREAVDKGAIDFNILRETADKETIDIIMSSSGRGQNH